MAQPGYGPGSRPPKGGTHRAPWCRDVPAPSGSGRFSGSGEGPATDHDDQAAEDHQTGAGGDQRRSCRRPCRRALRTRPPRRRTDARSIPPGRRSCALDVCGVEAVRLTTPVSRVPGRACVDVPLDVPDGGVDGSDGASMTAGSTTAASRWRGRRRRCRGRRHRVLRRGLRRLGRVVRVVDRTGRATEREEAQEGGDERGRRADGASTRFDDTPTVAGKRARSVVKWSTYHNRVVSRERPHARRQGEQLPVVVDGDAVDLPGHGRNPGRRHELEPPHLGRSTNDASSVVGSALRHTDQRGDHPRSGRRARRPSRTRRPSDARRSPRRARSR